MTSLRNLIGEPIYWIGGGLALTFALPFTALAALGAWISDGTGATLTLERNDPDQEESEQC